MISNIRKDMHSSCVRIAREFACSFLTKLEKGTVDLSCSSSQVVYSHRNIFYWFVDMGTNICRGRVVFLHFLLYTVQVIEFLIKGVQVADFRRVQRQRVNLR